MGEQARDVRFLRELAVEADQQRRHGPATRLRECADALAAKEAEVERKDEALKYAVGVAKQGARELRRAAHPDTFSSEARDLAADAASALAEVAKRGRAALSSDEQEKQPKGEQA